MDSKEMSEESMQAETDVSNDNKNDTMVEDTNTQTTKSPAAADIRTMLVASGCFWCVESDIEKIPGVIGAALRFVPEADMQVAGYWDYLQEV